MKTGGEQAYSLLELNQSIQQVLKGGFSVPLWVMAEISEIRPSGNGHCYLELVEKDNNSDQLVAKARATIWAFTFRMLKPYFETTTGCELSSGIKILVSVKVEFHELYGFSLNIIDIEPSYTMGELAKRKMEIIRRLEQEGVLDMNKEIPFPLAPQKIAIISSKNAAGFGDFNDQLENNPLGYKFYAKLFPAIMQGNQAEESIIAALEKIHDFGDFFDLVVITRGGGAKTDLSCFDSYWLAYHVAQFPLPVITGIGHQRDGTVVDLVAHEQLKTPTAVAEFIISKMNKLECIIDEYGKELAKITQSTLNKRIKDLEIFGRYMQQVSYNRISSEKIHLNNLSGKLAYSGKNYLTKNEHLIKNSILTLNDRLKQLFKKKHLNLQEKQHDLKQEVKNLLIKEHHAIRLKDQFVEMTDPTRLLKKGYSITTHKGKIIKNLSKIIPGDEIKTIFHEGEIKSHVKEIKKQP